MPASRIPASLTVSKDALKRHDGKVAEVVAAVQGKPDGKTITIRKATPTHQIHSRNWKASAHHVDVSALNEVLGYREVTNRDGDRVIVAVCEGQVTMAQLAAAAWKDMQMIPQVVPEYDTFTCAGLVNGEGIQSSGHRHGIFTNTITSMEAILGDGSVQTCSPNKGDPNKDLFHALREAYGSIGIVTLTCVTLREAKEFVRSSFFLYSDKHLFSRAFTTKVKAKVGDFLEGLVLAADRYVIIQSDFADQAEEGDVYYEPGPQNTEGDLWYYQHVEQRMIDMKNGCVAIEHDCIPTLQFLTRSMRGAWWMVECHVGLKGLTNRRWVRKSADAKMAAMNHAFGPQSSTDLRNVVLQDMGIRLSRLAEGIDFVNSNLGVYPLWVCPVYQEHQEKAARHGVQLDADGVPLEDEWKYLVDIGVYGEPSVKPFYHRRMVKALIEFVDAPSTWGTTYKTKDQIKAEYQADRERFHAIGVFTGVEEKVTLSNPTSDANSTERDMPMWRLHRDYGPYWWLKVPATLSVAAAAVGGLGYAAVLGAQSALGM